ncbi:B12-binding domain-containing radical SAM protein [Sedimentibacter sp.]|uniref:B12-binding domain-containing radical SAM protein n=1 Tax=Sedimentibacter sp. TaxID=1960295 RepID=UPI0028AD16E1|nr:B12-binding domain-containing radical SAM protein [Sedimentibacter sp.]
MIVFLKKVRVKTVFSAFEPVITEPLELCYLKSVLDSMNIENYIIDNLFKLKEPSVIPDVIVLTGYNVAENEIIKDAKNYKNKYPHVKIIVGGVHIQGNKNEFYAPAIDYVCHTQSLSTFKELIYKINRQDYSITSGVDSYVKDENSNSGKWVYGNKVTLYEKEGILPDRGLFYQMSSKLRYLDKRNVALVKGSIGCPYNCSYCYCKKLNDRHYVKPNFEKMILEMQNLKADYFWIVDDVLFPNRNEAMNFIDIIKSKGLKVKIIGYLRADFILREKDLLPLLKEAGLSEVIVGFEATNNDELEGYEKTTNALDYPEIISLLKENNIDLTALFMVHPEYSIKDFRNLYRFMKKNKIEVYTISIFTPIKGTNDYESLKDELITDNPKRFDFMHLVLESNLPKWLFYLMFYGVHVRLIKSKRVWKFIGR